MQTENNAPAAPEVPAAAVPDQNAPPAAPASAPADEAGKVDPPAGDGESEGKQQEATEAEQAERDEQGRFSKSKVQKRIDELTHARHTAERESARLREIVARYEKPEPAPNINDFATDAEYESAVRRHDAKEGARAVAAETARDAAGQHQQEAARAVAETYNQRVEAAITRFPDFKEVVGGAKIQISNAMVEALQESEYGPDLAYQLAKNPEEAQRLATMGTRQLDRELGRMEAAIAAKTSATAPAAPAARTTKAPAPASTGAAASSSPANTDPSKMSMPEFEKWMSANGSKYV